MKLYEGGHYYLRNGMLYYLRNGMLVGPLVWDDEEKEFFSNESVDGFCPMWEPDGTVRAGD